MNKLAILCTLLFASGLAGIQLASSGLNGTTSGVGASATNDVQEQYVCYFCFRKTLRSTIDELADGTIPLSEAHRRVVSAAHLFHPRYFDFLLFGERGGTDGERVAWNLVGHVRTLSESRPEIRPRVPALENELREFLRNLDDRPQAEHSVN